MSLPLLQALVTAWIIVVGYLLAWLYDLLPSQFSFVAGILLGFGSAVHIPKLAERLWKQSLIKPVHTGGAILVLLAAAVPSGYVIPHLLEPTVCQSDGDPLQMDLASCDYTCFASMVPVPEKAVIAETECGYNRQEESGGCRITYIPAQLNDTDRYIYLTKDSIEETDEPCVLPESGHRFDPTASNVRGVTGGRPTKPMTFLSMPGERVDEPLQTHNERVDWMIQYLWIMNAIGLLVGGVLHMSSYRDET